MLCVCPGMSLKKVNESEYVGQLRDPRMVMLLGFQGFATLERLHSQGVSHLDVKRKEDLVSFSQ